MAIQESLPEGERVEIYGSEGVAIKQLVPDDAEAYFALIDADRSHFKYGEETTPKKYQTVEDVRQSIEDPVSNARLRFGIWDDQIMVGSINLTFKRPGVAEVGYWVGGEHKGHGYALSATKLLIEHAFGNLSLNSLTAWVAPENRASVKTLERAGLHPLTASGPQVLYGIDRQAE